MKQTAPLALVLVSLAFPPAALSADRPVHVRKTIALSASAASVWSRVGNFCGIEKWHPGLAKCEIVSGSPNKAGAVRVLTARDGGVFRERLLVRNPTRRTLRYSILESPLPVTSYVATLTVMKRPRGGSAVEWRATFRAPEDKAADTAKTFEGIFQAGLDNLKATESAK